MIVRIGETDADIRVEAILSAPRFGPMPNFFNWIEALMPLGIRPTLGQGAFWGQVLQNTIEKFVDKAEFILTLDYDSFILQHDLERLFAMALAFQCDALTGFQVRREDGRPMLALKGTLDNPPPSGKTQVSGEWFSKAVQEVDSAHFGCTLISTAALKRTPKPWFVDIPDEHGGWGPGHVDGDLHFWKQFRAGGNRVFITPRVTIGHGEWMIAWPSKQLGTAVFQHVSDFRANGKPKESWQLDAPTPPPGQPQ